MLQSNGEKKFDLNLMQLLYQVGYSPGQRNLCQSPGDTGHLNVIAELIICILRRWLSEGIMVEAVVGCKMHFPQETAEIMQRAN